MNTAAMLEDLGHIVTEARSGAEALALVRSGVEVDLVVTDHAMPQMTGSELVQLLRAERPGLPIILATGYAELPARQRHRYPQALKAFPAAGARRCAAPGTRSRAGGVAF